MHDLLNGAALKEGAGSLGLLGIMAMIFVIVGLTSSCVVSLRQPWTRVAVRVVGSWVPASGLLMLGWMLKLDFGHFGRIGRGVNHAIK